MTRIAALASLASILFAASPALAATAARASRDSEVYCSGLYSVRAPRTMGSVVSGEESADTLLFSRGDAVYLRLATDAAKKPGERFLVVRRASDPIQISWFHGEEKLEKRMGRLWEDVGRVRVLRQAGKLVVARVESSCVPMQRGDRLVALSPRPVPSRPATPPKDISAALSRPAVGRVVSSKGFRQVLGAGYIAYVDWGTRQGARPGDRLVLFRRPGAEGVEIDRATGTTAGMSGFGPSGGPNAPRRLPRELLGQAIVLRASPTAATIFITSASREIELGDYAALE